MIAGRAHYQTIQERNRLRNKRKKKRNLAKSRAPLAIFDDIRKAREKRDRAELKRLKKENQIFRRLSRRLSKIF